MGMWSFIHLSQTSGGVLCIESNKQKLGWWPSTARLLDNVSHATAFLAACNPFSLTFQSPLRHNVIWGLLLSYQCKFYCIESDNYNTLSLPLFLFLFFPSPNESTAELAADISIHFVFPDWEQLLSLICNSVFGTVNESTVRRMAHTWSPYSAHVTELREHTILLWLHDNSVSMFTFNTLPLSFVIWCFPQH